jgi:quercetin dioxygenase-like cupin family protein
VIGSVEPVPEILENAMKQLLLVPALLLAANAASAQKPSAPLAYSSSDIKWGPVPPVLPAGAQIAVLQGNPFGEGVYTLRLKMPDGYIVPPHFHPTDEMVTVVSGTLLFAHGDSVDHHATTTLHSGGFVTAPKNMHHYVIARGPTVVQVHGMGPFAISYVHPEDDPRNRRN